MKIHFYLFLLTAGIVITGCGNDDEKPATTTKAAVKPTVQAPFRYQKHLEVSPGNGFDVLSWGRGATEVGAFLILHSDSANTAYTTTTGDLEGAIVDVYNADMDLDGNPELLIHAKSNDTVNYTKIYPFEFNNEKANKLNFPDLTKKQKKGYRGNDNFYIKDGKFLREFPIFDGDSATAKPSGAKRVIQYGLRNNSFTVEQLSKDSTDKEEPAAVIQPVKKKSNVSKKSSGKKKSSSRKRRRRRRD